MIRRFHHHGFTVPDADAAARFFARHFGMRRIGGGVYDLPYMRRQVGLPNAILKTAVMAFPEGKAWSQVDRLELVEYIRPKGKPVGTATNRPGGAHLCFLVDNLHAQYRKLRRRGLRFKSSPNLVTHGLNKGAWAVYFNGPGGIALELFQPPPAAPKGKKV